MLKGLDWSVINGAKVINVSIGYDRAISDDGKIRFGNTYTKRMKKLIDKGYDFVVVTSAGNSDKNTGLTFDASYNGFFTSITDSMADRVIVVGATNKKDEIANISNHGNRIDIVAPGDNIYSCIANKDNGYDIMSGTSMAAPHVTGVAALVWSANPGLTGIQVKNIIVNSAKNYGTQVTDSRKWVSESERRTYYLLNAKTAVEMAIGQKPKMIYGRLTGKIIALNNDGSDGNTMSGAKITLYSGINNKTLRSTTSDSDGYYSMSYIENGGYYLEIAAEGYTVAQFFVQIEAGVTTYIHRLSAVPKSTEKGFISGHVINAMTNTYVTDKITLEFYEGIGMNQSGSASPVLTVDVSDGKYTVNLPAGNYTVVASGDDYITTESYVCSVGKTIMFGNVVISPKFINGGEFRIVLTWGSIPQDLDSHLVGTASNGRFHVYYSNKNCSPNATLDVDVVSGYGPETITINTLVDGTYNYYVQDFSNYNSTTSNYLRNSQAIVRIYKANNTLHRTYVVPTDVRSTVQGS